MTGAHKGAVLCMALGAERSARIMQLLSPSEVEQISREIAVLPTVGEDRVAAVLHEFQQVSRAVESIARQPEAAGNIRGAAIVLAALIEGFTFFALIVIIIAMFALKFQG